MMKRSRCFKPFLSILPVQRLAKLSIHLEELPNPPHPHLQPPGRSSAPIQPSFHPAGITALPKGPTYAAAMHSTQQNQSNQQNQFKPRRKSTLLFGQAKTGKDNQTQLLAANVNLVASGVSKAATDNQLKEFLEEKGIKVTEIECMTYHPEARTKFLKLQLQLVIMIKP